MRCDGIHSVVVTLPWLRAEADSRIEPLRASCDVAEQELKFFEAASGEAGTPKLKKFSGVAYTGGAMRANYGFPVAIELSGLTVASASIPALKDHDTSAIVGHLTAEIGKRAIKVEGVLSGVGDAAQEVQALSANEFPWQMSVGVEPTKVDFVERGDRQVVNGRAVDGPAYVIRAGVLREVSFVAIGADPNTSGSVAANLGKECNAMIFQQWLKAKGFGDLTLNDQQKATLKAQFDAEQAAANPAPVPPTVPSPASTVPVQATSPVQASAPAVDVARELAELRATLQNRERVTERQAVLAQYRAEVPSELFATIEAEATRDNLTREATELRLLRARRPSGPAIHVAENTVTSDVLEAAACVHGRLSGVEDVFTDQQLQAAHARFRRGITLHEMLLHAAWRNGYAGAAMRGHERDVLRAAFSSADISGILANVANKFLLSGYMTVETTWRQVTAVRPVNDLKTTTSYRLVANGKFEQVGSDGKLKHGSLSDESYTNRARTYGKLFGISREHIINDDLGALTSLPREIGRGAALNFNDIFWTEFMDNSSFFTSGRNNYADGAATALSIDALTAAELLFLDQTDPDGNPLGVQPKLLLVPNALNVKAAQFTRDLEVRDTTASTKYTTSNPHAGKFTPVRSSYLSNTGITGYSTKAWYLLADPMDLAVIEVVFLNGVENPTIESADADFDELGVQMRGYWDFGVAKQQYRGGVKMKGEA